MQQHRTSPREEHRQKESLRVTSSPNLAQRFRGLKSLMVDLEYYEVGGTRKTTAVKYTVNLANAKSVFLFACPNHECVGGNFDLSDKLASAVAARLGTTTGEVCCQGWQSKTTIESVRCQRVLHYKFNLGY